jgi:hypothetical protein
LGDLDNGIDVATSCVTGWNWIIRQSIWVSASDRAIIDIVPHSNPVLQNEVLYSLCTGGLEEFEYIVPLYLNDNPDHNPCEEPLDLVVGLESSSWGVIKSQFTIE